MSDPLTFSVALRNDRGQKIVDRLDADTNPGYFEFYTGTRSPGTGDVTGCTKLGTCTLSKPCATVASGVTTFSAIADDTSADADGMATWLIGRDGAGNYVCDMIVTNNAGSGPCKINDTNILTGGRISVSSCVITEGNS